MKKRTEITPNLLARFAICLSLKDPSVPNPDEFDEKGSEFSPPVLFGDYEDVFLNQMLRAHLNRGTIALFARVRELSDFNEMVKVERSN
jgi:DNA sulfur modification protein DndE